MEVLNLSLPLFGLIFIGYLSAKLSNLNESALGWMNFFILYVALPALFFQLIREAPIDQLSNPQYILATTGATVAVFFAMYAMGRLFLKRTNGVATIQAVAASYANIGYMGPAITLATLGQAALIPTVIIFCFDNAFLFTAVPIMMAFSKNQDNKKIVQLLLLAVKNVVTHPFILATILGIIVSFNQIYIPKAMDTILTMLSNTAAPSALFTMGVVIANRRAVIKGLGIPMILFSKLIVHPVCVLLFLGLFGPFDQTWQYTALLMASLPPALNIYVMATDYQTYIQEASSIVLIGTIIAIFSVTYVLYLIR